MSEETKRCPFCGEEILAKAIKCKHCQSMLNGAEAKTVVGMSEKSPDQSANGVNISALDCLKCGGWIILALVAIFFAGWLYVWLCSIPFIFWLMPLMYGCLVSGVLMFLVIKEFRTNDIGVFITLGLIGGIVAYYANWVWFVYDVYDQFIMSPGELWDRIKIIQMARSIDMDTFVGSRRAMFSVKDGMLTLAWLLEFVMIFGGVATGFYYALTEIFYFCTGCKRWNEINSKPYKLASDKPEYELTSIEAIMQMTTPEDENSDHYTVTIFECPHCKNGTLSLAAMKAVLKDGKYEFKKKTLLNRILCPADKIKELKKIVSSVGIECKK